MGLGKEAKKSAKTSPIVKAIRNAQARTTGEIRVHLSRSWLDRDVFNRASKIFVRFGMGKTRHQNAVLIYLNLRKKTFAILGDRGIHEKVGQNYWKELSRHLAEDLASTHFENALATAVLTIGATLEKYFPLAVRSD